MKKIIACSALLLGGFNASFSQQPTVVNSQDSPALKEGKITYEITYPDGKPGIAWPVSQVVWIKNDMMKVETKTKSGTTIAIVDCRNKVATTLAEVKGKKYAIKTTPEDVQKEAEQIPHLSVQQVDDFKFIAGYYCEKIQYMIVNRSSAPFSSEIYVNHKILVNEPNWYSAAFREVQGFMFQFETMLDGARAKFTVKTIEPFTESDGIFKTPAGYEPATKEDIAKLQAKQ